MKLIVCFEICLIHLIFATQQNGEIQNKDKFTSYQLEVPGKEPITIIESSPTKDNVRNKWDVTETTLENDFDIKNLMTHLVEDTHDNRPRCYGPSCQEGFVDNEGPQEDFEDYVMSNADKLKDYSQFSNERLQAIAALAAKLKKHKVKPDRYSASSFQDQEDDNEDKVYTSWNRLKVKQHKHPFDHKDGWVTLEPVAWSTSKISKWKPNIKKQKPSYWNDDDEDTNNSSNDDPYTPYHDSDNGYVYPQKRPNLSRPGFINNKLHIPQEYETELPSKPSWTKNKHQQSVQSFQSSWSTDDSRRPHRPNCDKGENYPSEDSVYYGMPDYVMTDSRPSNSPYEYEALHQSSMHKRPMRRPTQVIYAGDSDMDDDRSSRPPHGDGHWVLLSTTKGYKNKKRQRSLESLQENSDTPSMVSHKAVSLTVLPVDNASQINMTTSHGGLLEVEKSFQTVEESKRDMDLKNDLEFASSHLRPIKNKVLRNKLVGHKSPDSSTVLAAVSAGMVPATMAMVVPMMLGRRRRRDVAYYPQMLHFENLVYRH